MPPAADLRPRGLAGFCPRRVRQSRSDGALESSQSLRQGRDRCQAPCCQQLSDSAGTRVAVASPAALAQTMECRNTRSPGGSQGTKPAAAGVSWHRGTRARLLFNVSHGTERAVARLINVGPTSAPASRSPARPRSSTSASSRNLTQEKGAPWSQLRLRSSRPGWNPGFADPTRTSVPGYPSCPGQRLSCR